MKLIYIAGNEEFNQGGMPYMEAIQEARKHNIYINTIFCGDREEGIGTYWKQGADKGAGKFFNINSDEQIAYIETPYDAKISAYNVRINDTYIQYGSMGEQKKQNQVTQDFNATSLSSAAATERTVSKSKTVYMNDSWDLVDKVKQDKSAIKQLKKEELPTELQGKSTKEIEQYVSKKAKEREGIQRSISELAKKRQEYIEAQQKKNGKQNDLGAAIKRSVIELAKAKGYTVEK